MLEDCLQEVFRNITRGSEKRDCNGFIKELEGYISSNLTRGIDFMEDRLINGGTYS